MRNTILFLSIVSAILLAGYLYRQATTNSLSEKVYIATEGEGAIAVLDPKKRRVVRKIDLSIDHEGGRLSYSPHNIQVSPDNKTVWVTANAGEHSDHSSLIRSVIAHSNDEDDHSDMPDQLVIIETSRDTIVKRIDLNPAIHAAHVVLTPDNRYAYATAQKEGKIYKVNRTTYVVETSIRAPVGSEPHGLRITPDGKTAYVALSKKPAILKIDLATDIATEILVSGGTVQTGITPDGSMVVASNYEKKSLVTYEPDSGKTFDILLPPEAKGPVQMYATPDSRFFYLADQGYYFKQPTGTWVYKIDMATQSVVNKIQAGDGPHGVVISPNGNFVYVTNLISGDVSIIDTTTDTEVARVPVGQMPNGISYWIKPQ